MSGRGFTPEDAQYSVSLVSQAFDLYPLDDVEPPESHERGAFLLRHPQYVDNGAYDSAARLMAMDRDSFSAMTPDEQDLGSSLMTVLLSEADLLEIAKQ